MPRKVRVKFEGTAYHVMARGNKRKPTFRDDRDRKRFLDVLREASERFGLLVHAYCLMPNHYHLVVETPRANLSPAMGWLQTTYTMRFNRRHRRTGHLFQGRYKAQLVDAAEYGQWLVRYVHYSPVRPARRQEPIPFGAEGGTGAVRVEQPPRLRGSSQADGVAVWGLAADVEARATRGAAAVSGRNGAGFGQPAENPWEDLRGSLVPGTEEFGYRDGSGTRACGHG